MNPKQIVTDGYDRIAERYAEWSGRGDDGPRDRAVALVLARLPTGAAVLELGCGTGLLATKRLAERFAVTGVDISARSVALARRNVPEAAFVQADMTTLDLTPASFDGVTAFYSITHVPRDEHAGLLAAIATWLRPGGLLVATMGASSEAGAIDEDWLGAPMYFSHYDAEANRRLARDAGLELLSADEHITDEDGVPVTFLWIVARKPERHDAPQHLDLGHDRPGDTLP